MLRSLAAISSVRDGLRPEEMGILAGVEESGEEGWKGTPRKLADCRLRLSAARAADCGASCESPPNACLTRTQSLSHASTSSDQS